MLCENINVNGAHLQFAGVDTVEMAEKYGTPLFLMDENRIREIAEAAVRAVQPRMTLRLAKQIAAADTNIIPLMAAGVFYYIFNLIVASVMEALEKKFSYYR